MPSDWNIENPEALRLEAAAAGLRWPNVLIIGAMKAGTSALHQHLAMHPDIGASNPKELNYFAAPRFHDLGVHAYLSRIGPGAIRLESSPQYTKRLTFPGTARRIHAVLGTPKLIYCVRDPIARIVSHWRHTRLSGRDVQDFDIEVLRQGGRNRIVDVSRYHAQLEGYRQLWPEDQIKIVDADDLRHRPRETVDDLYRWLGLPEGAPLPRISNHNRTDGRRGLNAHGQRIDRVSPVLARALRSTPGVQDLISFSVGTPAVSDTTRQALTAVLQEDVDAFRRWSGRDFPSWSM